jgi:hypothetical protein
LTISGGAQFEDSTYAVDIEDVDFQNLQINGGFFIVPGYLGWIESYSSFTTGSVIVNPLNSGNLYTETVASCTTAGSGSGPSGTGSGITDGTCSWNYSGPPHVNTAIKAQGVGGSQIEDSTIAGSPQGATVGIEVAGSAQQAAGTQVVNNQIGNFGKGIVIDNGVTEAYTYAYYNNMINNTVDYSLGSGGAGGLFIKDKNLRNLSSIIACSSGTVQSEFLMADPSGTPAYFAVAAGGGTSPEVVPIICGQDGDYRYH